MELELSLRLMPFEISDGPTNMACDEVLLESATEGVASLRFYGWSEATISLGYFQSCRSHLDDPLLADLPFVRRPSGGDALVHDQEVTYCLTLPRGKEWQSPHIWQGMHVVIAKALASLGANVESHPSRDSSAFEGPLCFHHFAQGDLLMQAKKVVGSAQRKRRGAIMQHGGILLSQSRYTPSLPGICELSGRQISSEELINAITHVLDETWRLEQTAWTSEERSKIQSLRESKYATSNWNCKR